VVVTLATGRDVEVKKLLCNPLAHDRAHEKVGTRWDSEGAGRLKGKSKQIFKRSAASNSLNVSSGH
jgi:hypothetical protein